MRRRRTVSRAYDMALEISQFLKSGITVLDVGCGSGFIAHHLTGILNAEIVGLDVAPKTSARINFLRFDGRTFPVSNQSFDAVLLCYVLHHARDAHVVLTEVRRVLRDQGRVIIYEDNPAGWWNRAVCWKHNLQWKSRTGACTFQLANDWRQIFRKAGFKVTKQRGLSRWRNLAHPVARNFFVLEADANAIALQRDLPLTTTLMNEIAA